ncbi:MAG: FAD-binding oxidoreductase [Rhizobiales bacterium]|nr:FAD-binding oxidoreductase [Hyphomicrobiales bacterium]
MAAVDQQLQPPASYWRSTAASTAAMPSLQGEHRCDIAIVGGGYSGLAAAHNLAEAGVGCVVLEAGEIGWGASGRSAGFLVLRYKRGFAALAAQHGVEAARILHRSLFDALANFDAVVEAYGLAPFVQRNGHFTAAHAPVAQERLEADARWLEREVGDRSVRIFDRKTTRDQLGTEYYVGGFYDPRAGAIHPYNFVRAFAQGLAVRGVPIFAHSPVTDMREDAQSVILRTPAGRVHAGKVIFATNGYTGLAASPGDLARRVVPVTSALMTTEVIPADVRANMLRIDAPVTDTKRILSGFRLLEDGRLLFAGRGDLTGKRDTPDVYRPLQQALGEIFPALADIPISHRWSGKVAITQDDIPHVGALSQRIFFALGYMGRGVLLTHLLGQCAARLARGERIDAGPMSRSLPAVFPFHRFRHLGMKILASRYAREDRRELQERPR